MTKGFFGESLPVCSGLTSIVKGHGHGNTDLQLNLTDEKAILLIRNPYEAIYGYRHYLFNGPHGHADISKFKGKGVYIKCLCCHRNIEKYCVFFILLTIPLYY